MLKRNRRLIPFPNLKLWMPSSPSMLQTASRRLKWLPAVIISALAAGKLPTSTDQHPPSELQSQNGITLRLHRHSSSQKLGLTSDPTATRRSRPYADMRWKYGININKRRLPNEAASSDLCRLV